MLKKFVAIMAVASLSFVACSSDDGAKDKVTGTTVTTNETATTDTTKPVIVNRYSGQEKLLLSTLRDSPYSDLYDNESDTRILKVAHDVCDELDLGTTVNEMIDELQTKLNEAGSSDHQAEGVGYLLGASVAALCPEYQSQLEQY